MAETSQEVDVQWNEDLPPEKFKEAYDSIVDGVTNKTLNWKRLTNAFASFYTFDGKLLTPDEFGKLINGEYWYLNEFFYMTVRYLQEIMKEARKSK